ncbi:MAG: DUF4384 domain-containing protein [Spirulina sp. SIO3F2]|nr:DUF4384 domain-containing protein [Spirulina sp. SIO3F2]
MSGFSRRHFLQFSAATLASLGLSQNQLGRHATRYGQVLAQSTPRKLALLVGINDYRASRRIGNLYGCVNDVELQRQLLIHQFGFNDADILTLTDKAASRQSILDAFENHLIEQARSGDVVVFHFSGHGSRVEDPSPIDPDNRKNSTLIPADEDSELGEPVKDIMGQTLFLLMSALGRKTENITAVLDSCYSGGGARGETIVRAGQPGRRVREAEFDYQRSLLQRLNLSPAQFQAARKQGIAAGVALASTQPHQLAVDYRFEDFFAGGFTFLLTQYLWQQTATVGETIAAVQNRIAAISRQDPLYEVKPGSDYGDRPLYFVPQPQAPAEAVITKVEGNKAQLWLGGLDSQTIEAFGPLSELVSVQNSSKLVVTQRKGLNATARIRGQVQPGDLLQESARAIPGDLRLNIGLDASLGRDRPAAAAAINQQNRMVALNSQTNGYPEKVHYILGRVTAENQPQITADVTGELPPVGSTGLFSPSLEVLPQSFGSSREAIAATLERLQPKLRGLLATRVISKTLNAQSSQLDVGVTLRLEQSNQTILGQAFTFRGEARAVQQTQGNFQRAQVPINQPFQLEVTNHHSRDLYLAVMVVDATGKVIILFPNEHQDVAAAELEATTKIATQSQLLVPDPTEDEFQLVSNERGAGELLVIASEQPMTQAILRLRNLARGANQARGVVQAEEPIALMEDFLLGASRGAEMTNQANYYQMNVQAMAAIAIAFEVV